MPATTKVAYTAAQTTTMMDNTTLNPVSTEDRNEVQVTLVYDGVDFNPALLLDALQTLGTVQTDKIPTRGNYNFIIT